MKRTTVFIFAFSLAFSFCVCSISRAAIPAYIDVQSGIIVGRGEAYLGTGGDYKKAREAAVDKAKSNIYSILERQPVDLDSAELRTIGEYIQESPDRQNILDAFISTAEVFKEAQDEDGNMEVTLILPVEGANGYRIMLAKLMGRVIPAKKGGMVIPEAEAEKIEEELTAHIAGRNPEDAGKPYQIAMLNFDNETGIKKPDIGAVFTERLRGKFQRERRFDLWAEGDSLTLLSDYDLDKDALWLIDSSKRLKLEGIDGLVMGSITKMEPSVKKYGIGGTGYLETYVDVELDLRILSARTGRWIIFEKIPALLNDRSFSLKSADDADRFIKMEDLDDPEGLASRAMDAIVDKAERVLRTAFPIEGYVLKVMGDRVYVNLTRGDGVKVGDVIDIYKEGDVLTDPVTGEEIDLIRDRAAVVKVTEVKETYSQTEIIEVPREPVNPGDIVAVRYE